MNRSQDSFEELLNPSLYQVFLFTCPTTLPFVGAVHPWFVVNQQGIVDRFGVGYRDTSAKYQKFFTHHQHKGCSGHLHVSAQSPFQALEVYPYSRPWRWRAHLVGFEEGDENSLAARMVKVIKESPQNYPFSSWYRLIPGPNSNTYAQWVLEQFPESALRLPWNAVGKSWQPRRD